MFQNPFSALIYDNLKNHRDKLRNNPEETKANIDDALNFFETSDVSQFSQTDFFSATSVLCYCAAVIMDEERTQKCYDLMMKHHLLKEDRTFVDCVLGSCYEQGDAVTAFKWVYKNNDYDHDKLQSSIGAVLYDCKLRLDLEVIYTDLCCFLKDYYLPLEPSDSHVVSDTVVHLLSRLLRFDEMIDFIENEAVPTAQSSRQWLEHKFECIREGQDTKELVDNTIVYWIRLYDACLSDTETIYNIGRLYYPMKWFMDCASASIPIADYQGIITSILYINWHITRIKEMMNLPLSMMLYPHITQYMSMRKLKRTFQKNDDGQKATWILTCADNMNDAIEGKAFFSYLEEFGVKSFIETVGRFGVFDDQERSSVFLGSFSETINDEYMLDLYAADKKTGGKGFCVDFSAESFDDVIEDSLSQDEYYWMCPLYRIYYANTIEEISDSRIKNRIERIAKNLHIIALFAEKLEKENQEIVRKLYSAIYHMLEEVMYLFKVKEGPNSDTGDTEICNWEREKELRTMKCVRGKSDHILRIDIPQGKSILKYVTGKEMIVNNICGGNDQASLESAYEIVKEYMKS